jgi:hypothetical protein
MLTAHHHLERKLRTSRDTIIYAVLRDNSPLPLPLPSWQTASGRVWVYVCVLEPLLHFDTCGWFASLVATKRLSSKCLSCHSYVCSINRTNVKPQCGERRALSCRGVMEAITFSLMPHRLVWFPKQSYSLQFRSHRFQTRFLQFCNSANSMFTLTSRSYKFVTLKYTISLAQQYRCSNIIIFRWLNDNNKTWR